MDPGRVLGGDQGGLPRLERQAQRPQGSQCPELAQSKGGGDPRVDPGLKPQASLTEAMDGSGNGQPECMEQGQAPVGGTPKAGGDTP